MNKRGRERPGPSLPLFDEPPVPAPVADAVTPAAANPVADVVPAAPGPITDAHLESAPPDAEARRLIERSLDRNLLVEAGAGSGKTESLVRRMAAGLEAGVYQVEHMAAVTFTRKAAAELRGRLQVAIERRLRELGEGVERDRLSAALASIERLFAGTIHAFAAQILRERPVEAGIAPGFDELDEVADVLDRRRAWQDHLARQRALESPVLSALIEAGVDPSHLADAFDIVCTHEEVAFTAADAPRPSPDEVRRAWDEFDRFFAAVGEHAPALVADGNTCPVLDAVRSTRWRLRIARRDRPADLASVLSSWDKSLKCTQKWWHADSAARKRIAQQVDALVAQAQQAFVAPFMVRWRAHVYALSLELLCGAREDARQRRLRALTLNYNDLLVVAAAVLQRDDAVRAALQRKYRWLFVDEFQDTDPVQADLLLALAQDPRAGNQRFSGEDVTLRPGALFVVGDPKQSIYRFRRADIEVYHRVRRVIEWNGGQVVPLTASFRATPALCGWVNRAFHHVFPAVAEAARPAFQPLEPVRPIDDAPAPWPGRGVMRMAVSGESKTGLATNAEDVARVIRRAIDAGRRPGDFLVLTMRRKALRAYAEALERYRVPLEVTGAGGFAESPWVHALVDLMRVLADPDHEAALVGVLRGPLFGIGDDELYAWRAAGRRLSCLALPADAEGHESLHAALTMLAGFHQWTRREPVAVALERVLDASGWLALAAAESPGGTEAGDLLHALDRVRRTTERGGTLADAADALELDIDTSEVESVPLEPGRRDVVRLMNLHKAKGLEAPVVVLGDPFGALRGTVSVRIERADEGARGVLRIEGKRGLVAQPSDWGTHERVEQQFLAAEHDRLRYVAATRARDLLIVALPGKGKSPWAELGPALAPVPVLDVPDVGLPPPTVSAEKDTSTFDAAALGARLAAMATPTWSAVSVTGTLDPARPPLRDEDAARLLRGPATGIEWGTLVHRLLEVAMRADGDDVDLVPAARWAAFGHSGLDAVIDEAVDTVRRTMTSEVFRAARHALERHTEVPFTLVDGGADVPRLMHGVIDLVYRTAAGWHIVDYKTDQTPTGDSGWLVEHYRDQLKAYARAWRQTVATESTPVRCGLHVVRTGETHWVEPE